MTYTVHDAHGNILSEHTDLLIALPAMRADNRAREVRRSDGALIARCVHSSAKIPMTPEEHRGTYEQKGPGEKSRRRSEEIRELRKTKPWIAPATRPS